MARVYVYNSYSVRNPKAITFVTGIIGVLLLTLGIFLTYSDAKFRQNAVATTGTVVQMQVDQSGDVPRYTPLVEFTDASGAVHRAPSTQASEDYGFARDEQVEILYNPDQLSEVYINNGDQPPQMGMTFIFASLAFFAIAALAFILHRRWMKNSPGYANRGKGEYTPREESVEEFVSRAAYGYSGIYLDRPKLMAQIAAVIGVFLLVAGIAAMISSKNFMATAVEASATVTSVEADNASSSSTDYRPTLSFVVDGQKVSAQSSLSDSSYNFAIGTKMAILYDPADPTNIRLKNDLESGGVFEIALLIGAGLALAFALYGWRLHRNRQSRMRPPETSA